MKCFRSSQPDGNALEETTALILWGKTGRWILLGPSICPYALKVLSHSFELCVFLVRICLFVFKFNIPSKFLIVTLRSHSKTSLISSTSDLQLLLPNHRILDSRDKNNHFSANLPKAKLFSLHLRKMWVWGQLAWWTITVVKKQDRWKPQKIVFILKYLCN